MQSEIRQCGVCGKNLDARSKRARCRYHQIGSTPSRFCARGHDVMISGRTKSDGACRECRREKHLQNVYGMSISDYEGFFKKQLGKCGICKNPPGKVKTGIKFVVDHDHATGKYRGLLCSSCNYKLSGLEDVVFKEKAIRYLEESDVLAD